MGHAAFGEEWNETAITDRCDQRWLDLPTMGWTKLNELGIAGRLVVCGFIGFGLTAVFIVGALLGTTVFQSPIAPLVLSLPLLPGLSMAALLHIMGGGSEELASALYFNAGVYSLVVFGIWQRQVAKRARPDTKGIS